MPETTYHLGIDPGVKNLAIALIEGSGRLVKGKSFDMMPDGVDILGAIPNLYSSLREVWDEQKITSVGIERFVPYKGVHSASTENILLLTGVLIGICQTRLNIGPPPEIKLLRAIEWKSRLCKHLVRTRQFDNPSSTFDKVYSKAAAQVITNETFKNDHVADATCIAYWASQSTRN